MVDARWGIMGVHPALASGTDGPPNLDTLLLWILPHALGIVLATPLIITLFERSHLKRTNWWNGERLAILLGKDPRARGGVLLLGGAAARAAADDDV